MKLPEWLKLNRYGIVIVIIVILLIIGFFVWWYHPQVSSLSSLMLSQGQAARLLPILRAEDRSIDYANSDADIKDKAAKIKEIHQADEAKIRKILSGEQYRQLVELERQHGGKALSQ
jgi:hypothetical protein